MSDAPLFQNADEQEQIYAPQQVGDARVSADETSSVGPPASGDGGDTPVAVPLSTGGGGGAVPASDAFDPGMDREARDLARGDTKVVGRDPQDAAR